MPPLTTFDCFDTVVTRAVGAPSSVGYVVARRLRAQGVCDVDPGVYVAYRQQAGAVVFQRLVDAATLADVGAQLADLLGLPAGAAQHVAAAEEAVEVELSRPVPGGIAAVERARADGHEVAFLSDTVLSSAVVGLLLEGAGARRDGERLWVSNELGAAKARGTAYAAVAESLGSVPPVWHHVGDDDRADVLMARMSGVTPRLEVRGRLNVHERAWERGAAASGGFSSLLAGAARRTRLIAEVEHPVGAPARSPVLASVVAPLAAAYLLWALRTATAHGCEVLAVASAPGTAAVALAEMLNDATGSRVTVLAVGAGGRPPTPGSGDVAHLAWAWAPGVDDGRTDGVDLRWCSPSAAGCAGYLADGATGRGPALREGTTVGTAAAALAAALPQAEALATTVAGDGGLGSTVAIFTEELRGVMGLLDPGADVRVPAWWAVRTVVEAARPPAGRRGDLVRRWRSARRHARSLTTVTARRLLPAPGIGGAGDAPAGSDGATRYERRLRATATGDHVLPALLADASATVRSGAPASLPPALVEVGAGVAGPLLCGYVVWCLQRAREAGCRRVRFVSRDGEVLLRIAERLVAASGERGWGWDLGYLHGNRRAWLLPSLTGPDVERVVSVASRSDAASVRSLLAWVCVEPEEVAGALAAAGQGPGTWDDPLPRRRHREVLAVLTDPAVAALVQQRADAAAAVAERYLRAQGLLDGEPFAIVDMEGHGNVGALLTALLERLGGRAPALECYAALTRPAPAPGRNSLGYLYDDARGTGVSERSGEAYVAMEAFTTGSHGMVLGYRAEHDGSVVPVVESAVNAPALAWGLADLRALLDRYAEALGASLADAAQEVAAADVHAATWAVLRDFWERPTRDEVEAWGSFPSPGERAGRTIGTGFTIWQVLASLRHGEVSMRAPGTWPAGVRSSAPWHLRLVQHEVERRRRRRVIVAR